MPAERLERQSHRTLREIPRPLEFAFRKDANPGIAEVEDAKKRVAGLKRQ